SPETVMIFIVLSGFAASGLSVCFCDARQGGGAYGKTGLPLFFPLLAACQDAVSLLECSP
ncbi:hypothetical protein RRF94_28070, partial [Escherichia coli]|nr:hypothetical protein [Escherichia coli]